MSNISIVIPCYNEAKNLNTLMKSFHNLNKDRAELILVNNGSDDETENLFSELSLKYQNVKLVNIKNNIGYGYGIMKGVREANYDIIAWTHADLQTDINDVFDAYKVFLNSDNYKNCVLKGKRIGRNLFDTFFTFSMSIISYIFLRVKLNDINAQPKIFHKSFIEKLKDPPNDFSLDLFFLYIARINCLNIIEFPVHFGKRLNGISKGGGTLKGKIKLIKRTWSYILKLKKNLN